MACVAVNCSSRTTKRGVKDPELSFHIFPKSLEVRNQWIKAVRRENWQPSKYSRLCSKHFEDSCFVSGLKLRKLTTYAVPTIFEGYPKYYQQVVSKRQLRGQKISSAPGSSGILSTFEQTTPSRKSKLVCAKDDVTPRKRRLLETIEMVQTTSKRRLKKIKVLREGKRRALQKVARLEHVIKDLKSKQLMEPEMLDVLSTLGKNKQDLLIRVCTKAKGKPLAKKYPPLLRKFALTLHFLSPRAYKFVRYHFDTCLPHPKTISKWYQTIDCEPGFTKESLNTLKAKADCSDNILLCCLCIDEMAIRKCIEWDGQRTHGYVDIGGNGDSDDMPVATEVLTFMLTCVNGSFKIPVGYFFINSLTGIQKAELVRCCLDLVKDCGVRVIALTFDGAPNNLAMATHLGCILNHNNLKTNFFHYDQEIVILLDPCHCLKLVRNTLGDKKRILDKEGNIVSWNYLTLLNDYQKKEQLHAANKLKDLHISYYKQKMKVKLASQLLSNSVCDALTFCNLTLRLPEFQGCEATCKFIKILNDMFDCLNTRNLKAFGYKQAILPQNLDKLYQIVSDGIIYITSLKFEDGSLVVESRRKTGFLGFMICLKSLKHLCENYICCNPPLLKFLCSYKLSQDHVELFFSAIRAKGGFNNNPSAKQFKSAYKKLLVHAEFKIGDTGNCIPLEEIPILNCGISSSRSQTNENISDFEIAINTSLGKLRMLDIHDVGGENSRDVICDPLYDHDYIINETNPHLTEFTDHIVYYISGFVLRKINSCIKCEDCIQAVIGQKKSSLTLIKDKGYLQYPSDDLFQICLLCEKLIRKHRSELQSHVTKKIIFKMILEVLHNLIRTNKYNGIFQSLNAHVLEFTIFNDHKYLLVKVICEKYINLRIHYIAKNIVCEDSVRNLYNKLVIFRGH